jgi:hypothetical protein
VHGDGISGRAGLSILKERFGFKTMARKLVVFKETAQLASILNTYHDDAMKILEQKGDGGGDYRALMARAKEAQNKPISQLIGVNLVRWAAEKSKKTYILNVLEEFGCPCLWDFTFEQLAEEFTNEQLQRFIPQMSDAGLRKAKGEAGGYIRSAKTLRATAAQITAAQKFLKECTAELQLRATTKKKVVDTCKA